MTYSRLITTNESLDRILSRLADNRTLIVVDKLDYQGLPAAHQALVQVGDQYIEHIQQVKESYSYDKVIAIGGCTALDFGRACAIGKTLIVIPTLLSNACLSTNRSVINYSGIYHTEVTTAPSQTIVSLPEVMSRHARGEKYKWLASGFGDLFSALSASIEFEYKQNGRSLEKVNINQVIANIPLCSGYLSILLPKI